IVVGQRDEVRTALGQARSSLASAEAERERARRVIDDMYTQVAEKWLAHQPRLQPLQREFLQKALRYYQDFARDDTADPEARLADGYSILGQTLENPATLPAAEDAYRQALAIRERLTARAPAEPEYQALLAETIQNLGRLHYLGQRFDQSGKAFERAVALGER